MALATVRKWCSENDKNLIKLQTMIGGVRADVRMWDTLGLFYILFSFSQNKIFDEIQHFYVMPCGCIRVLKYFKTWTLLLLLWLRLSHAMAYFLQEQDILRKCNDNFLWTIVILIASSHDMRHPGGATFLTEIDYHINSEAGKKSYKWFLFKI